MAIFLRNLVLTLTWLAVAASCGPRPLTQVERGAAPLEVRDLGAAYRLNSCALSFDDGEVAPTGPSPLRWEASHFQKGFDPSRLASVGRASGPEVLRFMKLDGVETFSMPLRIEGACAPLSSLNEAPANFQSFWQSLGSPNVIGVYLPRNRSQRLGSEHPVILLRQDTDRYSLIHEYLHHVFNSVREAQGLSEEEFFERFDRRSAELDRVGPLTLLDENDPSRVQRYLRAWTQAQEVLLEALVIFPLEEVAIESLMQEAVRQNQLAPTTPYNLVNSAAYIRQSFDQGALDTLQKTRDLASSYLKLAERHSLLDSKQALEGLRDRSQALINEGITLRDRYARRPLSLMINSVLSPHTHSGECAHQARFKAELEKRGLQNHFRSR